MKKVLLVLVVMGALALVASPALADIIIGNGAFTAHLRDGSSLYAPSAASGVYVPRVPVAHTGDPSYSSFASTTPTIGDENRAIFSVDQFITGSSVSVPEGILTGMLYDFVATSVTPVVIAGQTHLEIGYGALGRNPLSSVEGDTPAGSGGVLEIWLETGATKPVINQPAGYGFQYDVLDPQAAAGSPNGTQSAPFLWSQGNNQTGGPAGNNHAIAPDGFPNTNMLTNGTASDPNAILWLQMVVVPGSTGDLLDEDINTVSGSGNYATAFADIIGGSAASQFAKDVFGTGKDLQIQLTVQGDSTDGSANTYNSLITPLDDQSAANRGAWQVQSSDPVRGAGIAPIPEPATMTLLGLGIAALAGYRRKKA